MNSEHSDGNTTTTETCTEQALRASEMSYRRLFEAAQDGILILDVDTGRVTDVNPYLVKLLGYSHSEMVGQTVGELSPFKDIISNQVMLEQLQRDGYVRYEDLPLEARDGHKVAVEFVSNIYHADNKKVIQCNVRDITKRKQAEMTANLLAAIVESSNDGILVVDPQGRRILQNRRLNEMWKFPRHVLDVENDAVQAVFAANQTRNPQRFTEKVTYLYDHPDESSRDEIELIDGTILDRYSAPVRDAAGKYYGRIWYFRDLTEGRKMELNFRQAQKMESIGQLAGGIAHDFNNILSAIIGNIYLMQLEVANHPVLLENLENISEATRRATDLVNQILTFSRKGKQEREPISLNDVVLEALKLLRASVPATIRIKTELTKTPTVLANATEVHQVIMNLGTNAWQAIGNHIGELKVEMIVMEADVDFVKTHPDLHPGHYVQLSVTDTGCGMDSATLEHIFEPFFTTKPVGKGTGLGLAVVHGIMRSHGGGISVYSQPGEGTVFHLYFPVIETEAATQQIEAAPVPRGRGEHILFVDDEEALAALGKKMLERLGYQVTIKTSALEAIAAVRDEPARFDLVITDLTMPVMDGVKLGSQLLQIQPHLPIIITTGYSGVMTPGKARELGFQGILTKPCAARTLAEAVHRVLQPTASTRLPMG